MRLSYDLADPGQLGVDTQKLEGLVQRASREIDSGLLPSSNSRLPARAGSWPM